MKLKRNVPLSPEEQPRKTWPFINMNVGDVYEVTEDEWKQASKYAHTVAVKKKWKVTTVWIPSKKIGRVRRVS